MPYHGHIEDGRIVIDEPAQLPEGRSVTIIVEDARAENDIAAKLDEIAKVYGTEYLGEIEEALIGCRTVDPDAR